MNFTKRPNFIDYSKSIGIFLVVFGHYVYFLKIPFENCLLWRLVFNLYSFHIPLFFIISGYLFNFTDIKICLSKGIRRLIIPYLLISLICLAIGLIIDGLTLKRILNDILAIISGHDFFGKAPSKYSGPLWFVYSLFFIKVYMEVVKNIKNKWIFYLLLFIAISGWGITIYRNHSLLAFRFSSTIIGLSFFCIGFYAKIYIDKIAYLKIFELSILFVFTLLLLVFCNHFNIDYNHPPGLSIYSLKFGQYPFLFYVSGVAGTVMIMSISQILSRFKNKTLFTFSNGTIIVLGFQKVIYLFFMNIVYLFFREFVTSLNKFYFAILFSLLVTFICYLIIIISAKYFPFLLGNRKST